MIRVGFDGIAMFAAAWVVGITILQLTMVVSAIIEMRRIRQRDQHQIWRRVMSSPLVPKISVLVPAYNEEITVTETITGLLALSYPNLEIVAINDGSPDRTAEVLIERFELQPIHPIYQKLVETADVKAIYRSRIEPHLVLIDKFNGGKADSLNAGVNIASGELVCAIDADTLVAPDALQQLVAPFLVDEEIVAVGGSARLTNDSPVKGSRVTNLVVPKKALPALQVVEYVRAFIVGRLGWNRLGGNLIISGAFGVFRRDKVLAAGGYEKSSIGEDMELIVRLRRVGYENGEFARVDFLPEPVVWTEAPKEARVLARQRNRWERGLMDVLSRHKKMIMNYRYGTAGMLSMPFFFVVEFLSPIVEALSLTLLLIGLLAGLVDPASLFMLGAAYGFGTAVTILTLWFDDAVFRSYPKFRFRLKLAGYAVIEQLVYRQMTIVWRLWGIRLFLMGRTEWGQQVRKGFTSSSTG
ncbi:MAG: cellulose synthase/poly-beta-1,6-N-acetylglucosamine synthase-like glycosyltransferase [Acidimicrobiales bacterium]|jgi:cellulose synthase/poly-beta-1,6-N-acetylglucosamine synthase-like glycosyltransferase